MFPHSSYRSSERRLLVLFPAQRTVMSVNRENLSRVVVLLIGAHWLGGCSVPDNSPPVQFSSLRMPDNKTEAGYVQRSRPKGLALSADETMLFVGQEGDLVNPAHE